VASVRDLDRYISDTGPVDVPVASLLDGAWRECKAVPVRISLSCAADEGEEYRRRGEGNLLHERIPPFDTLSFRHRMQPEANDPKENR
jgi:hypothetical protein